MLACFRGNRKQAPPKFYRRAIVSAQVGHPFYDPHVDAHEVGSGAGVSSLSHEPRPRRSFSSVRCLSFPLSLSSFFLPELSSWHTRARLSTPINFQWALVKRFTGCYTCRYARLQDTYSLRFAAAIRSQISAGSGREERLASGKNDRNLRNGRGIRRSRRKRFGAVGKLSRAKDRVSLRPNPRLSDALASGSIVSFPAVNERRFPNPSSTFRSCPLILLDSLNSLRRASCDCVC